MSRKRKVLQGSASNLTRVLLSMLVSLVLPPFLVHHMAASEYSAWVLILQMSSYVSLLDFGLQTAIGKYVAEYDAGGPSRCQPLPGKYIVHPSRPGRNPRLCGSRRHGSECALSSFIRCRLLWCRKCVSHCLLSACPPPSHCRSVLF